MKRALPLIALTLLIPATAEAKPRSCRAKVIREALVASGKNVDAGFGTVKCADVTNDGAKDGVFTTLSGGTAGATHFGVYTGRSSTSGDPFFAIYRRGYKVGVDPVDSQRFDVQQPHYKDGDPNCCPSAFDVTPYRWNGSAFKAGKSTRHKTPAKRFFD
jgi:hypothetical protein